MKTFSLLCVLLVVAFVGCASDSRNSYQTFRDYQELADMAKRLERSEKNLAETLDSLRAIDRALLSKVVSDVPAVVREERKSLMKFYLLSVRDHNRDAAYYFGNVYRARFDKVDNVPAGEQPLPSSFKCFDEMPKEIVKD